MHAPNAHRTKAVAFAVSLLVAGGAEAAPKRDQRPGSPKTTVVVRVSADGTEPVEFVQPVGQKTAPLMLPEGIWRCFVRPTEVSDVPISSGGAARMWSTSVLCEIYNEESKTQLTQVSQTLVCTRLPSGILNMGKGPTESTTFNIRAMERVFMITLKCDFE